MNTTAIQTGLLKGVTVPDDSSLSAQVEYLIALVWARAVEVSNSEIDKLIEEMKLDQSIVAAQNEAYAALSELTKLMGTQTTGDIKNDLKKAPWLETKINDAFFKVYELELKKHNKDPSSMPKIRDLVNTKGPYNVAGNTFVPNVRPELELTAYDRNIIETTKGGVEWLQKYDASKRLNFITYESDSKLRDLDGFQTYLEKLEKSDKENYAGVSNKQTGLAWKCDEIEKHEKAETARWKNWKDKDAVTMTGGINPTTQRAQVLAGQKKLEANISDNQSAAQMSMTKMQKLQGNLNTATTAFSSEIKKLGEAKEKALQ